MAFQTGNKESEGSILLSLQPIHAAFNDWGTFHDQDGSYILSSQGEILTFT